LIFTEQGNIAKHLRALNTVFALLYPLRFTRGAWNALKESGFLPQYDDVGFIYELLRVNEVITVANDSFSTILHVKAENKIATLNTYAMKAVNECTQIETYLVPILAKLDTMKLPEIKLEEVKTEIEIPNYDDIADDEETS
jgi:hypothetical protein